MYDAEGVRVGVIIVSSCGEACEMDERVGVLWSGVASGVERELRYDEP